MIVLFSKVLSAFSEPFPLIETGKESTWSLFWTDLDIQDSGRPCLFPDQTLVGGCSEFRRLLGVSESPHAGCTVWVYGAVSQVREELPLSWAEQEEGGNVPGEMLGWGS